MTLTFQVRNQTVNKLADELIAMRPTLMRVANQRVRNKAWAEDAVSEAMLAALENPGSFAGRAKLRTWLVGILKHKLVDQMRRGTREAQFALDDDEAGWDQACSETAFSSSEDGANSGNPLECLARHQLISQLDQCLGTLPPQQARAFVLRYGVEAETDEICHQLQVSSGNLSVMLHRARNKLGSALQSWAPSMTSGMARSGVTQASCGR